ncbi:MAG: PQQ-binding-like beta-propeller repeat protein [Candidatus Schekmanbacteria bacterium]|nr:PQQ-binding-like beta-propeller repeat protein [Candidatus Schekmanbacteria bacterium]
MPRLPFALAIVAAAVYLLGLSGAWGTVTSIPTAGRSIFRLTSARLDTATAAPDLVGGTSDGRVSAIKSTGELRWDVQTGGFAFDVTAGNLDADTADEVVAACADGKIYAIDNDGRVLWTHDLGIVAVAVAIARLDGVSPVVVAGGAGRDLVAIPASGPPASATLGLGRYVSLLRSGNFDADTADEVLALSLVYSPPGGAYTLELVDGPALDLAIPATAGVQIVSDYLGLMPNGSAPQTMTGQGFDVATEDTDGDGSDEMVTARGRYAVAAPLTQLISFAPGSYLPTTLDFFYRVPQLAVGDFDAGSPGLETFIVNGPDAVLYDAGGAILGQVRGTQGFSDVTAVTVGGSTAAYLASAPNGDDTLYRVTFEPGWEGSFAALARTGRVAAIGSTIGDITDSLELAAGGSQLAGQPGPFPYGVFYQVIDSPSRAAAIANSVNAVSTYRGLFPTYTNLLYFATVGLLEPPGNRPDGKPWPLDPRYRFQLAHADVMSLAQQLEVTGTPFVLQVGHGNSPFLPLQSALDVLDAAPTACLGFSTAEDLVDLTPNSTRNLSYYIDNFMVPLLDAAATRGKMFIMEEKGTFWLTAPAEPTVRAALFGGSYKHVIVPSVEDSNSRSPDLNRAARFALWMNGDVERWASRMIADNFSFNRAWDWEYPFSGHAHLRYNVTDLALGASVFMNQMGQTDWTHAFTTVGREAVVPFLRLLGKGIAAPPTREQMRGVSPVVLTLTSPTSRYVAESQNGHRLNGFGGDLAPYALGQLDAFWGMAPTRSTDLSSYLWQRRVQYGNHLPATPFGFVAALGGATPALDDAPWSSLWNTDGDTIFRDGVAVPLDQARVAITADLVAGAAAMPIEVTGEVFAQVAEIAPGQYVVYLVDPAWQDPSDREVTITPRAGGVWTVADRIAGRILADGVMTHAVTVPAGAFRIIELTASTLDE